ncbi:MAG: flagellar motor stator protein MotA [Candidatus Latescibacteria bacterium]|nr:flagellar motor stator protein MotA [Candidatus Latescibacterota bacterium]
MLTLIGILFALGCVVGGFIMEGGNPAALFILAEYIIILGCSLGTLVAMSTPRITKRLGAAFGAMLKGDRTSKKKYTELLTMLYDLFQVTRKDGLLGLESHVEDPANSEIFSKYPAFVADHHAMAFLCDTIRLIISSNLPAHDLEALMDADIETRHAEEHQPISVLQKVSDALPGLGIVAAVLGIVITMAHIDGPAAEIGHKVAAALTGTFLGILLSYGVAQPIATNMELLAQNESRYYFVMKTALVAFWKMLPASVAVEFARRTIDTDVRPSFSELEEACRASRG